jgi:hypothetical protein
MNFNNLNWHDSIIKKIIIDRKSPGINDDIRIEITWPNGIEGTIIFKNVYWADLDMNFGVVSSESVLNAKSEGINNEIVKSIYLKWKGYIDNIDLNYYEVNLNSTASKLRIVSHEFIII